MSDAVIKIMPGQSLLGTRFWRQDFAPTQKPRFEVYEYVGHNPSLGKYWFRGVGKLNKNCLISKGHHQLNTNGFHPFVVPKEESNAAS